jgi:hypothetical protein
MPSKAATILIRDSRSKMYVLKLGEDTMVDWTTEWKYAQHFESIYDAYNFAKLFMSKEMKYLIYETLNVPHHLSVVK